MDAAAGSRPSAWPGRRRVTPLLALLLCATLVLGLCAAASPRAGSVHAFFPLYSATVAQGEGGALVAVSDPSVLVPGYRVLAGTPDTAAEVAEQRAWLASGEVPDVPGLGGSNMVRDALLDLHTLSAPYGVAVAGWAGPWRYVWPRDSALVAVALARTGHRGDAERVLTFLQRVQPESGPFQARYRPDGSGVPDARGPQTDSLGWALWSLAEVTATLPPDDRRIFVERYRSLLDRSTRASLAVLDNPRALPPPSSDYWEMRETKLTLSTAALVQAGLGSARQLYLELGETGRAAAAGAAQQRSQVAVRRTFAAGGYPRTAGGGPGSVDLGVSYLLPPFTATADPGVAAVWRHSAVWMGRAAGGLAPGGSWRDDGVSWTTATSSYALTAAFGDDREDAVERLRWLDAHRTSAGSLPEKVLADGRPASAAPLAWAAAAVVIAADQLQQPR